MSGGPRDAGEGELVSRLLGDAINGVPLPAPWQEVKTEDDLVFYTNPTTEESTWHHPLREELEQLSPLVP
eukprot:s2292_g3.t1